ncbi:Microsomal glutathione S-transferase 1 [Chionoecetes opilio]|uniref:Microsomal glutathione S-transferase 1 n=1 Tax=Chionoecetes opilio TaxID=41210 RepID=A0A8J5CIY9_CHIOP|nr:Microsomal glutathione S-transferase 1 [Chionoecetes opilio]
MSVGVWSLENPAFLAYLFYAAVLAIKMIIMSPLTGYYRMSRGAFTNPEDCKKFGVSSTKTDPDVERVRRAHQNDLENIPLFFVLAPLFLFTQPSLTFATLLFRAFTIGRILHTIFYLRGSSLRPLGFIVPTLVNVVMAVNIVYTFH